MSATFGRAPLLASALLLLQLAVGWPPVLRRGVDATSIDDDRRALTCDDASRTPLNSFLWTVERPGGGAPVYFFGTIHVPYTRVWDYIPQNAKDAFRNSDHVFFELDLTNHHTAAQLASCQLLPGGETLDRVLPRDLYRRLKKHFNYLRRKMPEWLRRPTAVDASALRAAEGGGVVRPRATVAAEPHPLYADYQFNAMAGSWERLRPVWVMLTLNSLTESEVRSFGVPVLDLYLSQQAVRWSKHTGAIEKVDEQCTPLNQLSPSQVIFALNQTLAQHEQQRDMSVSASLNDDLIHHYSCGDLDSVLFSRDASRMPAFGVSSTPGSGKPGAPASSGGGGGSAATAAAAAGLPPPPPLGSDQSRMAKEIDAYFQTELLYKRNERMAERVAALLRDHPTRSFFFAFGAGHFIGQNTVIDHLKRSGFTVKHLTAEQQIASLSQKEFAADMNVPVPLNPYVEALTSFNQMHSAKIRQRLHNQGRRQQQQQQQQQSLLQQQQQQHTLLQQQQQHQQRQHEILPPAVSTDDSPATRWDRKQTLLRRPERGSTLAPFNSLWQRIGDEEDLERELDVVTPGQASQPSRIWRPSSSSAAAKPAVTKSYMTGCIVCLMMLLVGA